MSSIEIRRLAPADDRAGFESGNQALDAFFRRFAGQNQFKHRVGTTYVALVAGSIAGFVTVSPATLTAVDLPGERRGLPAYPLPVLRLGRLAVNHRHQGAGIGYRLVVHVFGLAEQLAHNFGCIGVLVDAKPEAVAFYERLGFLPLAAAAAAPGQPTPMFLALARASE
jgi:predicted N-acetyltransferase YhbS